MADEVENLTLRLLQEMRADMMEMRAEVTGLRTEMNDRFDALDNRVDGNTLILNMLAGLVSRHEDRLDDLEERRF